VGEALPYPDDHFDLVFSNEVIEHVDDDRATAAEMVRVTRPGGAIVAFAPNRLYPFETHGAYFGKRYVFGNIPFINWLPDPLRDRFAPHVRAYTQRGLRALFAGEAVELVHHRVIYPGFDNISARHPRLGGLLRRALYVAEHTPLHTLGLSHFLVLRKSGLDSGQAARDAATATGTD
jgi:SAM-dependent methyltransferase